MKILDRYLIKQFLQTIIFGLLAFTTVFIVIDAMENLDDFIDQDVTTLKILHYYVVFAPEILKLMTPVAVLFAALFTAGKTSNLSELTAMRASGVSLYRFMAPFVVTSLVLSGISIYFGGYIVPMANKTKIRIEQVYLKKGLTFAGSNIYFQDSRTSIVNISFFDNATNRANRVSIQDFDPADLTRMTKRTDCEKLEYDSVTGFWKAINGTERNFIGEVQTVAFFDTMEIRQLNFYPVDLNEKQRKPQEMDLGELSQLIDVQERAGNDPTASLIEYHSRYAFAMTSVIVVLFGLPISAKRRGGLAVQVGINILITFIYMVFMKVSQAFGKNGELEPLLTAWFANLIFLAGALITLPRMRR